MLEWRLDAFRRWKTMTEPTWSRVNYPPIDYQDLYYYAAPKKGASPKSLDEVDPAILETYKTVSYTHLDVYKRQRKDSDCSRSSLSFTESKESMRLTEKCRPTSSRNST